MTLDYIEQMAKEYNELLKTHPLPKARSFKTPSTTIDPATIERNFSSELDATRYLAEHAESKYKAQLFAALEAEYLALSVESSSAKRAKKFASPNVAYRFLLKKQAENLCKNADFLADVELFSRLNRISSILAILGN